MLDSYQIYVPLTFDLNETGENTASSPYRYVTKRKVDRTALALV